MHEYIILLQASGCKHTQSTANNKYIITFGPKGKYDTKCGIDDYRRGSTEKSTSLFTSTNWELCQHITKTMELVVKVRFSSHHFEPCGRTTPATKVWKSCHINLQVKDREDAEKWFCELSAEIMSIFSAINGDVRAADDKIAQQSARIGEMEKKDWLIIRKIARV